VIYLLSVDVLVVPERIGGRLVICLAVGFLYRWAFADTLARDW
jgi:hypothetical protein